MIPDPRPDVDVEWTAELEDRAAERVDRDSLLGQDRVDRAQARADHHAAECAALTERAARWEAIKERSGHQCDYGWRVDRWWL